MHSSEPCALRHVPSAGRMADTNAGYEPHQFTESTATDPSQSFFRRVHTTSIFGFAGNLATDPLDLEINDEQTTDLLASPLFPQEREANADRLQVYYSQRENFNVGLVQTSIQYG